MSLYVWCTAYFDSLNRLDVEHECDGHIMESYIITPNSMDRSTLLDRWAYGWTSKWLKF